MSDADCREVRCPKCGQGTPAASNRSDDRVSYRCDACGHGWTEPAAGRVDRDGSAELPPVPAIDAQGG